MTSVTVQPSKEKRWLMFDRIATQYDKVNGIMTGGLDRYWRYRLIKYIPKTATHLLDLATGTMDVAIAAAKKYSKLQITAMDMSQDMLAIGKSKVADQNLSESIQSKSGDATQLPLETESVDVVTVSFGIRNFNGLDLSISEMYRVLRPKGRFIILEATLPENRILRWGSLLYLRYWIPIVGKLFARNMDAYKYLNQSIETFPQGDELCQKYRNVGFEDVHYTPLTGGVVQLIIGDKP